MVPSISAHKDRMHKTRVTLCTISLSTSFALALTIPSHAVCLSASILFRLCLPLCPLISCHQKTQQTHGIDQAEQDDESREQYNAADMDRLKRIHVRLMEEWRKAKKPSTTLSSTAPAPIQIKQGGGFLPGTRNLSVPTPKSVIVAMR